MRKLRLLDLYSGAGGAAMGYYRAGFEVYGIDHKPQKNYPFPFVQGDALEYLRALSLDGYLRCFNKKPMVFDAIHASPPCQCYSQATFCRGNRQRHPDLVGPTRDLLIATGKPWVIENVERAPLSPYAVTLCGLTFGLKVFRHRLFESSHLLLAQSHVPHGERRIGRDGFVCVAGRGGQLTGWAGHGTRKTVPADHRRKAAWEAAMQIDWMTRDELSQAIPPAYTEYIGRQLVRIIGG